MSTLITADIHLNEKPHDSYRWGLLDWIGKQVRDYDIENVLILGDATDSKDRHSSYLVNRFSDKLIGLASCGCYIYILKGNHDYVNPDWPFFAFLDHMPNVYFIDQVWRTPLRIGHHSKNCLFLPATNNYKEEWDQYIQEGFKGNDYIFAHATFQGALAENGTQLSGISPSIFKSFTGRIFSGDIHAAQKCGRVEYIGAPYHTRFGDAYKSRCIFISNNEEEKDLYYPCPSKHVIEIRTLNDLNKKCRDFKPKDWVKVRVRLLRSEYPEWPSLKEKIKSFMLDARFELYGPELLALEAPARLALEAPNRSEGKVDPIELVKQYGKENRISKEGLKLGIDLLKEI